MSSTITHNLQCSRCPRIDSKELDIQELIQLAESPGDAPPTLEISFAGHDTVVRQYLCGPCQEVVLSYLGNITRQLSHKSSVRSSDDEGEDIELLIEET